MIAIHSDNLTSRPGRFPLQFLEKVQDLELVAAAVEDVADLDDGGGAAGPSTLGVDEAGEGEGLLGLGEVAVEVADGDDAVGSGVERLQRRRRLARAAADGEVNEGVDEGGEELRDPIADACGLRTRMRWRFLRVIRHRLFRLRLCGKVGTF
ncbi:hypothetical protein EUGRSUZ_H00293 [Eucalyptus grandis]|uniref:Uncharacterized protein n=2 Tax=Eucalyptus grandis TaxID=71139 RepID=A0ACC3JLK9_EUCGR|nr:hypothetical protein EUGRSUZ_H00293 [Eucalyptus grandis]